MQVVEPLEGLIETHPYLSGLKPEIYHFLRNAASLRRFASHQRIFHEGTEADHFYLIVRGHVAIQAPVNDGGLVTIQTLGPGEALGWSWLFPPRRWQFTATTLEPTDLISFNAAALLARAEEDREFHDELFARVLKTLFERLQSTRLQLAEVYRKRPG